MKKIDWKNLSYYDFIGFVAVTAILLFALYFGGLWYATYDYRIQRLQDTDERSDGGNVWATPQPYTAY